MAKKQNAPIDVAASKEAVKEDPVGEASVTSNDSTHEVYCVGGTERLSPFIKDDHLVATRIE